MSHLDPDVIALLAMGEDVTDDVETAHLATCAECADELAALRRTVMIGRAVPDEALLTPPARVWDAISVELGLDDHRAPDAADRGPRDDAAPAPAADAAAPGHLVPRGGRVRRRARVLVLTGILAVAVIVAGVWTTTSYLGSQPVVVAEATLDGFPAWEGAAGAAKLEEVDGHSRVVVTLSASIPDDGYREVWLLAADGSALVSLGTLEGTDGEFAIPDDVDLDEFTVVDISQEPLDGDDSHSGDSIVRGALSRV